MLIEHESRANRAKTIEESMPFGHKNIGPLPSVEWGGCASSLTRQCKSYVISWMTLYFYIPNHRLYFLYTAIHGRKRGWFQWQRKHQPEVAAILDEPLHVYSPAPGPQYPGHAIPGVSDAEQRTKTRLVLFGPLKWKFMNKILLAIFQSLIELCLHWIFEDVSKKVVQTIDRFSLFTLRENHNLGWSISPMYLRFYSTFDASATLWKLNLE